MLVFLHNDRLFSNFLNTAPSSGLLNRTEIFEILQRTAVPINLENKCIIIYLGWFYCVLSYVTYVHKHKHIAGVTRMSQTIFTSINFIYRWLVWELILYDLRLVPKVIMIKFLSKNCLEKRRAEQYVKMIELAKCPETLKDWSIAKANMAIIIWALMVVVTSVLALSVADKSNFKFNTNLSVSRLN